MNNIETVRVIKIETNQAEQSVKTLKQRMKELKDELAELEEGTEEYTTKSAELGAMMRTQADITENARFATADLGDQLATGTKIIQGGIGAVTGITAALSLMGVEMGDDTKLQQKLTAAIAVLSSIDAIDTSIKAFKGLTSSIRTSTIAQRALNVVMKANPVMLAASAVGLLATALGGYALATRKAKEETEELKKANEELEISYKNLSTYLDTYSDQLTMEKTSWYKKVSDTYEQWKKQAQKEMTALKTYIQQIGITYAEAGDEAGVAMAKAVNAMWKMNHLEGEEQKTSVKELIAMWKAEEEAINKNTKLLEGNKKVVEETTKVYDEFERRRNENQIQYNDNLLTEYEYLKGKLTIEQDFLKTLQEGTEEYDKQLIRLQELKNEISQYTFENQINMKALDYDSLYYSKKLQLLEDYYKKKETLEASDEASMLERKQLEETLTRQLYDLEQSSLQYNMWLLQEQHSVGLMNQMEFNNEMKQLEIQRTENEIAESERRRQVAEEEKEAKIEIERLLNSTRLELSNELGSFMGSLAEGLSEETEAYKNLKAAEAIINTLSASVAAFAGITSTTGGWGIAVAIARAAGVIATGMATVKRIYAVDTTGGRNTTQATISNNVQQTLQRNYTNTRLTDGSGMEVDLSKIANEINDKKVVLSLTDLHTADNKYNRVKLKNTF